MEMKRNLIIESNIRRTVRQVISEMMGRGFTVHFMLGLPGSGKSTFIQNNLAGIPVISRDNIRIEMGLCGEGEKAVGTREEENQITEIEYDKIRNCCENQEDFVIDDTNLNRKYRKMMIDFIRSFPGAHIVVHHLNTPLEVCIDRRKDDIPSDVMRRIFDRMSVPDENEYDELDTINYDDM